MKRERALGDQAPTANALGGAHVALLFEKPSLRTISTFEIAVREIGGEIITPFPVAALSEREPAVDVARNLERWVKCVVMRTFAHSTLLEFAQAAPRLHVVNALTDQEHPCQALADLQTLHEVWGGWKGRTVAFIGDGNNVATSLAQGAVMLGTTFHIASPEGYELPAPSSSRRCRSRATARRFGCFAIPHEAVKHANAVYTDVWTSMGQEAESAERRQRVCRVSGDARFDAPCRRTVRRFSTVCRHIATKRCRPTCSNPPRRSCSIRPRTVSTVKRRYS